VGRIDPPVSRRPDRAQVVHRHAGHTAPARAENLFGAMAVGFEPQNRRPIHGPLPAM